MQKSNYFTRAYRIARILLHISIGLIIAGIFWPIISEARKNSISQWWCKRLLACFNIRVITHGVLPDTKTRATMFVANHISWMDIHAINSVIPLRFIAKSEVSNWPVFGYLVRKSGTVFIDRGRRKDAIRIIEIATSHLQNGVNIGFFPEGTTTEGTCMLKFKSSIVQAAINANAALWPVAICYPIPDGGVNTQIAYAGETTMGESIFNILRQKNPVVELHFLAPISSTGSERRVVTQAAFAAISTQLNL